MGRSPNCQGRTPPSTLDAPRHNTYTNYVISLLQQRFRDYRKRVMHEAAMKAAAADQSDGGALVAENNDDPVAGANERVASIVVAKARSDGALGCWPPPGVQLVVPLAADEAADEPVAATVVAPQAAGSARVRCTAQPRSRRETFVAAPARPLAATASSSASARPTRTAPASTATVAGTAPRSRTAASHARATSRLRGNGMPCVMMVLSSATTGRRAATAARTSSRTTNARCVLRRLASSIPPVVLLTSYNP